MCATALLAATCPHGGPRASIRWLRCVTSEGPCHYFETSPADSDHCSERSRSARVGRGAKQFLEMAAEEKMKQGMNRKDALRAVRLERGNLEVTKEVVALPAGNRLWRRVGRICASPPACCARIPASHSLRYLRSALGIGATSALFSMVEAVLLKPASYQETSRLAVLWTDNVRQNLHEERTSYPNFERLAEAEFNF